MTGYTDPQGRRLPTAPTGWPFGTVKPPTPQQLRDDVLRRVGEALL
jgi:hypothetical protein